ncbi:periplasmic beta-glucosidase [Nonlabens dokdonensis DSW-6]|uniref:beta-glucosidase n=3 Tax=Nonlabens dokdonensis TaxID=328515 RepID=L7WF26_NONDD|nr:periplasmic beta-glucosidase [Nonlabens dokdonensis DSW-6]
MLTIFLMSCTENKSIDLENNDSIVIENSRLDGQVDSLLNLMTLEEKIGQMNQYNGFMDFTGPVPDEDESEMKYEHIKMGYVGSMLNVRGVEEVRAVQRIAVEESRLGIPLIFGYDVIHGYRTMSPIPLAEAASWDLEAVEESARLAAKEASAAGINWTFAPMVDISRDARWGRVMEGAGEDPFLGSEIAKARVQGFQGDDLAHKESIVACAKHFAAYGFPEAGREYNNADLGTSTLYNSVLPPFKAANDAGVRTFMNSFNQLNGIPATANDFLLRDILKEKWQFEGFVVSDWGSIAELVPHGFAPDGTAAARLAANAGTDMDMESNLYVNELAGLVKSGKVDIKTIDDAVKRILKVKFELGLFDDPYRYCNLESEKNVIGSKEIQEGALDMALKSIVLLKNENQLLPLNKANKKVVLIGALASDKNSPLGNWRATAVDDSAISVLEGMQEYNENIIYSRGPELVVGKTAFSKEVKINDSDVSGFQEAIQTAKNADVVVLVLGEHGLQSGEGRSRSELGLPGLQQKLLEDVYQVNKNIVLVLNNGRPLAIPWAKENIPAIVEVWQLGSQSGNAIAKVLYGDYNPSGKLPMTFPRSVGQVPIYYNGKSTGRPNLPSPDFVFWSHYQDVPNDPLWVFGHGLSYTDFEYSNLQIVDNFSKDKSIKITVDLKNAGPVKGKEVVQLYIRDSYSKVVRPLKELKGFQLIDLEVMESREVVFNLTENDLGYFDNEGNWFCDPGTFDVFLGGSSNTEINSSFELTF